MASNYFIPLLAAGLLLSFSLSNAKEFTVGDEDGWALGIDYQKWAANKEFHIGDTLVFNYGDDEETHNVVRVNGTAFTDCVSEPNMGVTETGNDRIVVSSPGNMWFICGVGDHCAAGMNLQITVKTLNSSAAPASAPI